jgi:hypothetical protein
LSERASLGEYHITGMGVTRKQLVRLLLSDENKLAVVEASIIRQV